MSNSIKNIYDNFKEKVSLKNKEIIKELETVLKENDPEKLDVFLKKYDKENKKHHVGNYFVLENKDFDILLTIEPNKNEMVFLIEDDSSNTHILDKYIHTFTLTKERSAMLTTTDEYFNIFNNMVNNKVNVKEGNLVHNLIFDNKERKTAIEIKEIVQINNPEFLNDKNKEKILDIFIKNQFNIKDIVENTNKIKNEDKLKI